MYRHDRCTDNRVQHVQDIFISFKLKNHDFDLPTRKFSRKCRMVDSDNFKP